MSWRDKVTKGAEVAEQAKWVPFAEPVGDNAALKPEAAKEKGRKRLTGGKDEANNDNVGGVVVYVKQPNGRKEEVSRVGFIRATSENPNVSFEDKLDEIVQVAQKTCDTLNSLEPDGELQ